MAKKLNKYISTLYEIITISLLILYIITRDIGFMIFATYFSVQTLIHNKEGE